MKKDRKNIVQFDSILPFRLIPRHFLIKKLKSVKSQSPKLYNRINDYFNVTKQEKIDNKIRKSIRKKGKIKDRDRRKYLKAYCKLITLRAYKRRKEKIEIVC